MNNIWKISQVVIAWIPRAADPGSEKNQSPAVPTSISLSGGVWIRIDGDRSLEQGLGENRAKKTI